MQCVSRRGRQVRRISPFRGCRASIAARLPLRRWFVFPSCRKSTVVAFRALQFHSVHVSNGDMSQRCIVCLDSCHAQLWRRVPEALRLGRTRRTTRGAASQPFWWCLQVFWVREHVGSAWRTSKVCGGSGSVEERRGSAAGEYIVELSTEADTARFPCAYMYRQIPVAARKVRRLGCCSARQLKHN